MTELSDERLPAAICAPGEHQWEYLEPAPQPDPQYEAPHAIAATHRCRVCGVEGMMEILNDGRPQRRP